MRVPCENLLGVLQLPLIAIALIIVLPEYTIEVILFCLLSSYFFYNSLCVYYFENDRIIKSNRLIKTKSKFIFYHELDYIKFNQVISIRMDNNIIDIKPKKESKLQNLPNIMISNWSDVEEIIAFLKDKDVKLIINN